MKRRFPKDYWLLWTGSAVSNFGDGLRLAALPLLAATLTRDPLAISVVTAVTLTPWILIGPFVGSMVDRLDRRRLMVSGQVVRGVTVALLAVLVVFDAATMIHIYVVSAVIGVFEVVVDSSSQAAIPLLAGPTDLERANSRLISAQLVMEAFVGAPAGAFLFALIAAMPFGIDAVTYLTGALLVSLISTPMQESAGPIKQTVWTDIRDGMRFVWEHGLLRGLALTVAMATFALGLGNSILVLLALEELGISEAQFGLLLTAVAVGGLAGSTAAAVVSARIGKRWTLTSAGMIVAGGQLVLGLAPTAFAASVGLFLGAFGQTQFAVVGRALRQLVTPDRILGRVVTSFRMISVGGFPLGALVGGVLARATNLRVPYVVGAALAVFFAGLVYRLVTPDRLAASTAR